jgi:hypothetical protein
VEARLVDPEACKVSLAAHAPTQHTALCERELPMCPQESARMDSLVSGC